MRASTRRIRHAVWLGATAAAAAALAVAAVTSSAVAQPTSHAGPAAIGPGYPPPGGIYTPFTNCPILNPIMQESTSGDATGCVTGAAASGSITIGNITTPVVRPVNVQFGIWDPPNATAGGDNPAGGQFAGGILPPPAGLSAMLATKPDLIPESLTTMLGCPSTNPVVENLCEKATYYGGKYNDVYALAQSAGQLTNFTLFSWTQRVMFRLINPLLGSHCYIGSANNPVVLNPQLSIAPGGQLLELPDPNPTAHPNTVVLEITAATAADTIFTAPGVTGCGPGGAKNIPVDEQLDTSAGLPSASGVNSLTLSGEFSIADCYNSSNQAKILLSAFKASVGVPPPSGSRESVRRISGPLSAAALRHVLRGLGIH
jgi:hypothetical protein